MFRPTLALLLLAGTATLAHAQSLHGKVEGKTYHSPTGQFRIVIPVLAELGGDVTDTPNVVTFQDDFNTHVSIAAFQQDATQRWEMNTRERKDYLVYFFSNFVLADFRQTFDGVRIESAKFLPGTQEGALLTYLLVPGGSMFAGRVPQIAPDPQQVAKRGNLLFVRNGHVFIISTELAERIIEGKSYEKKTEEEDEILRNRLLEILSKMSFPKVAAPAPAADAKK